MRPALSLWQATAPDFASGMTGPVDGRYDVAIIGGGFTGLSAALALAKGGAKVALLEAGAVIGAASGRNGGQCNAGTAHDFGALASAHGVDKARAWYLAHCDAVDTVERLAREEGIACDFRRVGRAKLAAKPEHFTKIEAAYKLLRAEVDPNVSLVDADGLAQEIRVDGFYGALIQHTSAQLHVGRFGVGLAHAAARAGAYIWEQAPVTGIRREGAAYRVETPRGAVSAAQVLVATGGASPQAPFGWFRRRIVTVGSFAIATAPIDAALVDHLFPGRRNYVTSRIIGNYFRLTADNRLVFGGRARFALSNPASDLKGADILEKAMLRLFPALAGTPIEHRWGGAIDLTQDRLPRAGEHDGLYYAMGYSGHGVQMATHMGGQMAKVMGGDPSANPFADLNWPAIPGHLGKPWFLPFVGAYYRVLDYFQ
ncbi:NAD(P)/FAD-dependent oxidoreductase [Novosphingobium sp. KACC 22771]|uniref:NAD(P)/FAD-dependent oxidoreductase n=1 Tax=Novosphingobium sp. KACC 22771 TaxID=3025670 RepID=UPI002365BD6E|nr:FAD-binding oxidoreductase [Novosphingobium sp. KACC 22771]WDF71512.1 FAD-binding oxidoreductase [Novosphingobium sp. KACC 22771]